MSKFTLEVAKIQLPRKITLIFSIYSLTRASLGEFPLENLLLRNKHCYRLLFRGFYNCVKRFSFDYFSSLRMKKKSMKRRQIFNFIWTRFYIGVFLRRYKHISMLKIIFFYWTWMDCIIRVVCFFYSFGTRFFYILNRFSF
jgi:hypothetical protein